MGFVFGGVPLSSLMVTVVRMSLSMADLIEKGIWTNSPTMPKSGAERLASSRSGRLFSAPVGMA